MWRWPFKWFWCHNSPDSSNVVHRRGALQSQVRDGSTCTIYFYSWQGRQRICMSINKLNPSISHIQTEQQCYSSWMDTCTWPPLKLFYTAVMASYWTMTSISLNLQSEYCSYITKEERLARPLFCSCLRDSVYFTKCLKSIDESRSEVEATRAIRPSQKSKICLPVI